MLRRQIEPRRTIFIGVEGQSERAFVRFLGKLSEQQGGHLHLAVEPATGGDSVAVVEYIARYLSKHSASKEFACKLVLIDGDRIQQDQRAQRNVYATAAENELEVILQNPNLEGLLLRLHPKYESKTIQASTAERMLKKVWPEYDKPPTVEQLERHFDHPMLLRAAKHDKHLKKLLKILELG